MRKKRARARFCLEKTIGYERIWKKETENSSEIVKNWLKTMQF